jgi:IS30 family transposase
MHPTSPYYRHLQPEDRMTLASLQQQNYSIRAMARVLHRSPSTISRELSRNADASGYASSQAQKRRQHRRQSARPQRRLHADSSLFGLVQHFLLARWSPEQIALTLARIYPKGHKSRVSHETIYNCIYAQPVGELRLELVACLRQAHNKRTPRSKGQDRRGQIPDMLSIHVRPPEIEDRQFPGHWEGDLIKGQVNASAVAWFASTCPRAQICRSTAKSSSMRLPMKLTAGPENASGYDHRWRSTVSYSSTTRSIQHSFINYQSVALHF